jgi:hypothetical protein
VSFRLGCALKPVALRGRIRYLAPVEKGRFGLGRPKRFRDLRKICSLHCCRWQRLRTPDDPRAARSRA